jgi:Ca2+-transporting ATPase
VSPDKPFPDAATPSGAGAVGDATPGWYSQATCEILRRLGSDVRAGLPADSIATRQSEFGPNRIEEGQQRSPWTIFVGQFRDFMIVVLLAAAAIAGALGDAVDSIVILAIVLLNAVMGFAQEFRAERAIAALRQMAAPEATVIRESELRRIPSDELVPGDLVVLEAGGAVPADLRIVEAVQLHTDESALTGESEAVEKTSDPISGNHIPLGDRRNLAFKGTTVTSGRGHGVVVATGMQTELGRIASLLESENAPRTPLQRRLTDFGRSLALAVLAICGVLFVVGLLRGEPPLRMLLTSISLAVAAIPEALPAVVSVALALGARTMVRHRALVRRLPAVETLGSVTYICSDKTGTLTENRMRAEEIRCAAGEILPSDDASLQKEPWRTLLLALAISNDARAEAENTLGDPTEVALLEAARARGLDKPALEELWPRIGELPFDAARARMTTLHAGTEGVLCLTKGAPESVLPRCTSALAADGPGPIDHAALEKDAWEMAARGLRVLAMAMRSREAPPDHRDVEEIESELVFVGLVGLLDPPRARAREAVGLCRTAGITPVMITGDHPATARAIAHRLDLASEGATVLSGPEVEALSDHELRRVVDEVLVYARVAPEQKIRIVAALQDRGEIVAMTGDGVNDAPALQRADIGVAMGVTGTDVAKEASDMVLLDDDFATIVEAIREGRRIFDNIRKFVKYTMTSNSGEIWTIFLAPLVGLPIPLLPIHILWINLVTDGLPGLALTAEGEEEGIMERPPRAPDESLFAHGLWQHVLWVGLLMGAVCLMTQAWALHQGRDSWQTMVFTVLTLSQLGHAWAGRVERSSVFRARRPMNRVLAAALGFTFAMQMATVYAPVLNPIFHTVPLTAAELGLCLALSSVVFFGVELEKWAIRRGWLYARRAAAV